MYDANTGNLILTFSNATVGGTRVMGPSGELLIYVLDGTNNWLSMWNSSKAIGTSSSLAEGPGAWMWRPPTGSTLDWRNGVQWNVTTQIIPGQTISTIDSGVILATTGTIFLPQNWQMEIGYNQTTGQTIWVQNRTTPIGSTAYGLMGPASDGVYTEFHKGEMKWYGYSITTGQQSWGPSEAYTNAWGSQGQGGGSAYGNLYGRSIDGIHAFKIATGEKLWDFYAEPSGNNFPGFSTYPFLGSGLTIADGKLFVGAGNSHGDPLFSGAELYAINATSGKQVWSINGFFEDTMPIADGILVAFNGYDNQLYAFSRGQSATTVSAPDTAIPQGTPALIKGTVTDQSPGTTCLGIAAAGTPAISDDSMSAWMEYLYMQRPKPTNETGVPVHLTAVDPNGNFQDMGTTTSNVDGSYAIEWLAPVPGIYHVTATFEGSDSYYSFPGNLLPSCEMPLQQ